MRIQKERSVTLMGEALLAVEKSADLNSLKTIVRGAMRALGYDRIMIFSTSTTKEDLLDGDYWVEGDWFDDAEALDAQTYIRHCSVTHHIRESDQPFFWSKLHTSKGKKYRFVAVPKGPGLHGLQVPIFSHAGLVGAVSFAGTKIDGSPQARLSLAQLGATAFFKARSLLETPRSGTDMRLSKRELEVLEWVASGRRVADIAATLGLSERTVENHLRRIRQRLRVNTMAQAISAAQRAGAI